MANTVGVEDGNINIQMSGVFFQLCTPKKVFITPKINFLDKSEWLSQMY